MPNRIENYALIGDCETVALVSRDGSIDWLCWPRFDSGAVFAALLGDETNGRWSLAPEDGGCRVSRRYLDKTLILETVFTMPNGSEAAVVDFMPLRAGEQSHVVRIVEGRRGHSRMCCDLMLRFDYGSIIPWVTRQDVGVIKAIAGPNKVVLRFSPCIGASVRNINMSGPATARHVFSASRVTQGIELP
jgi:GH15 family glucan-1,4-alpha-glucosidase